jgi:hypothetical protein
VFEPLLKFIDEENDFESTPKNNNKLLAIHTPFIDATTFKQILGSHTHEKQEE